MANGEQFPGEKRSSMPDRSLRILHFSETLPGGPASIIEEIAPAQVKQFGAKNVRFLLPQNDRNLVPNVPDECFVGFERDGRSIKSLFFQYLILRKTIRAFSPNIIHLHSSLAGLIGRLPFVNSSCKAKIVYCPHGWAFSRLGTGPSLWATRLAEALLAPRADAIVAISEFERSEALRAGLARDRLRLIYNGIDDVPPVGSSRRDGAIELLFVGRHDPQKGLDIALRAMSGLAREDVHLHVVGDAIVSNSSLASQACSNVTFHGWLPRSEVVRMLERCDALLMPSRWEGFGLAALEAMRAGKSVIASNVGALPELVKHGSSGWIFPAHDHDALRTLLEDLRAEELGPRGTEGRRTYKNKFTASKMNAALRDLYSELSEMDLNDSHVTITVSEKSLA
jgi:glycosyltransferase involved in cell wall biosynthesis